MFDAPEAPLSTTIPLVPPASCSVPFGDPAAPTTPLAGAVNPMMQPTESFDRCRDS